MSAARASRRARTSASAAIAVMNCVPLMSESPSFAVRRTGESPARASASPPASNSPSNHASPSPTSGRARCASGARSPLAPTEPRAGTRGSTPRPSAARRSSTVATSCAGIPLCQRVGAQQHRGAGHVGRIGLTDAAGVAAEQPQLELVHLVVRDGLGDEPPKAGVDAVGVLVPVARRRACEPAPSGRAPPLRASPLVRPRRRPRRRRGRGRRR